MNINMAFNHECIVKKQNDNLKYLPHELIKNTT